MAALVLTLAASTATAAPTASTAPAGPPKDDGALLRDLPLDVLAGLEVVSVSRHEESAFGAPAAVQVLTGEEIRRSGARDLADALRSVPGIHVARINASTWAVSARGFADAHGDKLLVLVDGRSLYTPLFSGIHWSMHHIPVENIERIEVVRGPGASVWGVNAVNGVINVVTKSAHDTQGWSLRASTGTELQGELALQHGGKVGRAGAYRAWVRHAARHGLVTPDGADAQDDWNSTHAAVRVDGAERPDRSWHVRAEIARGRHGVPGTLYGLSIPATKRLEDLRYESANVSFNLARTLRGGSDLVLEGSAEWVHRDAPDLEEARTRLALHVFQHVPLHGGHALAWGAGVARDADDLRGSFEVDFTDPSTTSWRASGYVQGEIALAQRLRLTLGTKVETGDQLDVDLQPSVSLAWTPNEHWTAWGSVARALRSPNRVDRDARLVFGMATDPRSGLQVVSRAIAGSHPRSEVAHSAEIGFRFRSGDAFAIDWAAFAMDYSRLRSLEPLQPRLSDEGGVLHVEANGVLANGATARSWGTETRVEWRPLPRWRIALSHAYLDLEFGKEAWSRDALDATSAGRGHAPRHRLHLSSRLDLGRNWQIDVEADRPLGWNDAAIPEATRLDVRVGWRPSDRFDLELTFQDLLSDGHVEFGGQSPAVEPEGIERSAHVSATWRF